MNKIKIVILTGTDGVGKTTIKKALEIKSNWKYICLDRFTDSIVYDELYLRENRKKEFLELEYKLSNIAEVYLVYLDCNLKEQIKRLKDKKEDIDIIKKIKKTKKLYVNYLKYTKFNSIIINTSKYNIESCVDKIIKFIGT